MDNAITIPIDDIELDVDNPRIKHYLEMYTILNDEHMFTCVGSWSGR